MIAHIRKKRQRQYTRLVAETKRERVIKGSSGRLTIGYFHKKKNGLSPIKAGRPAFSILFQSRNTE